MEHKTEFQGGLREGNFIKCEKYMLFDLKAKGERFVKQILKKSMLKIEVILLYASKCVWATF